MADAPGRHINLPSIRELPCHERAMASSFMGNTCHPMDGIGDLLQVKAGPLHFTIASTFSYEHSIVDQRILKEKWVSCGVFLYVHSSPVSPHAGISRSEVWDTAFENAGPQPII